MDTCSYLDLRVGVVSPLVARANGVSMISFDGAHVFVMKIVAPMDENIVECSIPSDT